ncbi:MAG: GNAT family N-acetyltransferase [Myxococcales bacterium]|nr:GNAT family N-acetyltransferase [Myxococcales bacterium]
MNTRATIRFVEEADAEALFEAARSSRAELAPWMPWCHADYCIEESRQWLTQEVARRVDGSGYAFAILDAAGAYCGGCGLNAIDRANRRANLGYWVRTSHRGQGLATEAVRQLSAWAFEHTDLIRLEIVASIENVASIRVADKAGAVREGIARSRIMLHGREHDAAVFSIVREP